MTIELKPCPDCGKNMIQWDTGEILTTYPAQHVWKWWCGCGNVEDGGVRRDKSIEEIRQKKWEQANVHTGSPAS